MVYEQKKEKRSHGERVLQSSSKTLATGAELIGCQRCPMRPRGAGTAGLREGGDGPPMPQALHGMVEGRAAAHQGSTTDTQTPSHTQQWRGNQSDTGTGGVPRDRGRCRQGSGREQGRQGWLGSGCWH